MNQIWKTIPSFPIYEASNDGKIRHIRKGNILSQLSNDIRGYQNVSIFYKGKAYTKKVSRLVWEAFNGCECANVIDHIDNDVFNNNISNLQCVSHKQNSAKRSNYKKSNKYGLTLEKKKYIINHLLNKTMSVWNISKETKIPPNYLYTILQRGTWNHLWIRTNTTNS